ncbi:hypothetical protein GDO86_013885, partial [Hymenochirus boettgeri]
MVNTCFPTTKIPRPQILSTHLSLLPISPNKMSFSSFIAPSGSLPLSDFWLEAESIRQTQGPDLEESSPEPSTLEDGEAEAAWLQDAGLTPLFGEQSPIENAILLSTLTQTQAAAVQRRVDSYSSSLRKRWKPPARDVRDVFPRKGGADRFAGTDGKESDPHLSAGRIHS